MDLPETVIKVWWVVAASVNLVISVLLSVIYAASRISESSASAAAGRATEAPAEGWPSACCVCLGLKERHLVASHQRLGPLPRRGRPDRSSTPWNQ